MHRSRTRQTTNPLTILIAGLLVLLAGLMSPATLAASPLHTLSIALMYESTVSDEPTLVISARLPDETPLPAEMVLPAPEGANVLYAAEFFPEADRENIPVQALYEIRDGVPVVVLTLTESRIGLVDVGYPGSRTVVDASAGIYEAGFDVVLPMDAGRVGAAVALGPDVEVLDSSEPVAASVEPDGNRYHSIERIGARAGETIALTLQVRELPDVDRVDETVPWMVIAVIAMIIAALIALIMVKQRGVATRGQE